MNETRYTVVAVLLGLVLAYYKQTNSKSKIPRFPRFLRKDYNYDFITKQNGKIPKVYETGGWSGYLLGRFIVIADFDLLKEAFSKKTLSNRPVSKAWDGYRKTAVKEYKLSNVSANILGPDSRLLQNEGIIEDNIGQRKSMKRISPLKSSNHLFDSYNDYHKSHRQMWHHATARIVGKKRIQEITTASAKRVCELIRSESKLTPEGFDPRQIFTLGTLNVISDFAMGKQYDLDDPEFGEIVVAVDRFFANLMSSIAFRTVMNIFPDFVTRSRLFYYSTLFYGNYEYLEAQYGQRGLFKAILRQVHEHEKSIDPENPRDYTDYQRHCLNEIELNQNSDGSVNRSRCHYTNSILLENFRMYPVGDTLSHLATEDVQLDGVTIPKNSVVFGGLTAIMLDPKNFEDPHQFKPDRFLDTNGQFKLDIRVCPFSVGLRNCIGKELAREQYFTFAAQILQHYKIIKVAGSLRPVETIATLQVEQMKLIFEPRNT